MIFSQANLNALTHRYLVVDHIAIITSPHDGVTYVDHLSLPPSTEYLLDLITTKLDGFIGNFLFDELLH
jgi:hypothetical protein